jgi:energy-converting hydrogenase Eha subunit A
MSDEPNSDPAGTNPPPAPAPAGASIDYAMAAPKRPMTVPKHLGLLIKVVLGLFVAILLGYLALIALSPKARQWATSKQGPTPFKFLNQLLAIPAQAIGKTKAVVAASDARVGVLNGVISEEEDKNRRNGHGATDPFAAAPGAGTDGAAVSSETLLALNEKPAADPDNPDAAAPAQASGSEMAPPKEPSAPVQVTLAGGIIIANAPIAGAPDARPAFLYWVFGQNVRGVNQSNPPRILLNNRSVTEGQVVNPALGITFDHLDPEKKLIVFRDESGALVTRSY